MRTRGEEKKKIKKLMQSAQDSQYPHAMFPLASGSQKSQGNSISGVLPYFECASEGRKLEYVHALPGFVASEEMVQVRHW